MTELREYFKLKKKLFLKDKKIIILDFNNPDHKRFNELSIRLMPKLKKSTLIKMLMKKINNNKIWN